MPIKIVTDSIGLINLVLAVLGVVTVGVVFAGQLKKNTLEVYKATNEALDKQVKEYTRRLEALESSQRVQEMRIWKAEFEAERRDLLLSNAREEIRILEKIARASLRFFLGLPEGAHQMQRDEVQTALRELEDFRHKSAREMDDWELAKNHTMNFIDERTSAAEVRAQKKAS